MNQGGNVKKRKKEQKIEIESENDMIKYCKF